MARDDEPMELDDEDERPRKKRRRPAEDDENDRPKKKPAPLIIAGAVGLAMLLSMMCCGGVLYSSRKDKDEDTYPAMPAEALVSEWKANPATAAEKYKRSGVEITGRLASIKSNVSGQTYIDVRGQGDAFADGTHIFVIEEKPKEGLRKCKIGDRVVVRAKPTGDTDSYPSLRAYEIRPAE